jgi:ketosteroid isomerase-like protein
MGAYLDARLLAGGVSNVDKFINRKGSRELLKAALPHRAKFIDNNDPSACHYLLDELKDLLLLELKRMLEGKEADREAIDQAKQIMDLTGKIEAEQIVAAAEPRCAYSTHSTVAGSSVSSFRGQDARQR